VPRQRAAAREKYADYLAELEGAGLSQAAAK